VIVSARLLRRSRSALRRSLTAKCAGTAPTGSPGNTQTTKGALPAAKLDTHALLKVISDWWDPAFSQVLGSFEQGLVSVLRDTRNRWAHNAAFDFDDAYRVLDAAQSLLTAISAAEMATKVAHAKEELLRQRYEDQARRAGRAPAVAVSPTSGIRPWREVITPHEDVATGQFGLSCCFRGSPRLV
jgi:hypothetical protein